MCRDGSGTCITGRAIRSSRDSFSIHPSSNRVSTISPAQYCGGRTIRDGIRCRGSRREISCIWSDEQLFIKNGVSFPAIEENSWVVIFRHIAEAYPLEILNHCYKHGYKNLADQVAPHTIALPLPKVAAKLTHPGLLPEWVRYTYVPSFHTTSHHLFFSYHHQLVYYDHWMELPRFTRRFIQQASTGKCGRVMGWEAAFLNVFAYNPRCVFSPPPIPITPNCSYVGTCHVGEMNTLFLELSRKGSAIPTFSSIRISS